MKSACFTEKLEDLLRRSDSGEPEAFDDLISFSIQRLTALTRKMLAGEDFVRRWQQTDDVFQNAALRLQRALKEVHPTTKKDFFSLAATMIRREILDMARQLRRRKSDAAHHYSEPLSTEKSSDLRLWEGADETSPETWCRFHEAIDRLDGRKREMIELLYYQGMTIRQAAEMLDVSERTVRRLWRDVKLEIEEVLER